MRRRRKQTADSTTDTRPVSVSPPEAQPRSTRFWLCVLLAVALLLRGGALIAGRDARLLKDEELYRVRAVALLDGEGYVGSYRSFVQHRGSNYMSELPQYPGAYQPPLYQTFMAAIMAVTNRSIFAVKLVQVLISTVTVGLVLWIGRAWFGAQPGWYAAWICALYPNLIAFSHYLWSETVFIFLFMLAIGLLTVPRQLPGRRSFFIAGLLFGLAALTRSITVFFLPVLLGWLLLAHWREWRGCLRRAALAVAVMAVVIAPWTIRNYYVHDGFVLIETSGAFNIWRGNTPTAFKDRPPPIERSYRAPFDSIPIAPVASQWAPLLIWQVQKELNVLEPTDLQIVACAKKLAWDCIRDDPGGIP